MAMNSQVILSRGKPTTQSSVYLGLTGDLAVDGNYDSFIMQDKTLTKTCFHTKSENNPFWKVDLLESFVVDAVIIYNRMDCCTDRIVGSVVELLNSKDEVIHKCGVIKEAKDTYYLSCNGKVGNKVRITNPGSKTLHVCEVDVLGIR